MRSSAGLLKRSDWWSPLIWNEATGRLVGGHQRLTVLKDMGMDTVEVSVVRPDEAHEKALNIALNKIDGAWDNEALAPTPTPRWIRPNTSGSMMNMPHGSRQPGSKSMR